MEPSIEELCGELRTVIGETKKKLASLHHHSQFKGETVFLAPGNLPEDMISNMHANITLAFRHLEDARMRIGKVIKAHQGGVSILDE